LNIKQDSLFETEAIMKNVLITGGNGMIGNLILQYCLESNEVGRVTSILRKPSGIKHEKLTEITHQDFLDFSDIEAYFKNQDICYYCVGVYSGQVGPMEFKRITIDFTKAFADILKTHSPHVDFCFLSGQGADSTEKSKLTFAKQKGLAENYLIKSFSNTYIFRPGYIYPVTPRKEPNIFYKLMRPLFKPLSYIYPNIGVTSEQLAAKIARVGLSGSPKIIHENQDIRS
jgi:nucleoside-diphosphate-sugar epimerase